MTDDVTKGWIDLVVDELDKLAGQSGEDLMRSTIIAVVDRKLQGLPVEHIFGSSPKIASASAFYKWRRQNSTFRSVLDTCWHMARDYEERRALVAVERAAVRLKLAAPLASARVIKTMSSSDENTALRAALALLDRADKETGVKSTIEQRQDGTVRVTFEERFDLSRLSDDELAAWERLMEKAQGDE